MAETFKHHIVILDGSVDLLTPSFPHTTTSYPHTPASEIPSRIADATILIATGTKLSYSDLVSHGPKLQLLASLGVGYDNFDPEGVRERGLTLVNVPAQNTETVVEHAFALYGAVKRNIVGLHGFTVGGERWESNADVMKTFRRPPKTNKEEVLGIIGYGAIGQLTEKMAQALSIPTILIAERKNVSPSSTRPLRHPLTHVLRTATLLILTCPLTPLTQNLLSATELALLRPDCIVINVARGGVVDERALVDALREGRIAGAGVDVFATEPATRESCPLLEEGVPNLVCTPHVAWFSTGTIQGTLAVTKRNLEAFVEGNPQNVVAGPGVGPKE